MTRVTIREALADTPHWMHGARSESSFVQACLFADRDQAVFAEGMNVADATADLGVLKKMHEANPTLQFYLRSWGQDGLVILKADTTADSERAQRVLGKLPTTLTVESNHGETAWHIFTRSVASPDYLMRKDVLAGVSVQVVPLAPLPNANKFRWRANCSHGELCGSCFLPRSWVCSLPANNRQPYIPDRAEIKNITPLWTGV